MKKLVLAVSILFMLALVGALTAIAAEGAQIRTDVEIAGELGLLIGDGDGLTDAYLAKSTTRLQAAIMFLRLKGLQDEAFAYTGSGNFTDAELVNPTNQAVLAYLKANQELGWAGVGDGKFDPSSAVTAQQFYKVMLEALGYKTGVDFDYNDTIAFAASKGLTKVAANGGFVNADIATATVEALKANVMGSEQTLAQQLVEDEVIKATDISVINGTTSLAPLEAAKTYEIIMENYAFSSATLTIEVGSSVTFTNKDTAKHNAMAVDGSFETAMLAEGESDTVTFDKAGVYDYYCLPHMEHMTAQIIVK